MPLGFVAESLEFHRDPPQGPFVLICLLTILCDYILNYLHLMFEDDLKMYHNSNNVHDRALLQSDIGSVQNWCFENGIILNVSKVTLGLYPLCAKLLA
jgi:hypothetical protein